MADYTKMAEVLSGVFHPRVADVLEKHLNVWANKWQQKSTKGLQPGQKPPSPPSWVKFARRASGKLEQYYGLSTAIKENWDLVATALLKRYGVSAPRINSLWANAIVVPSYELRGFPLIVSLHAAGWAGLAAIRLAPNLSSLPFRSLCLFLIFAGLVHCVLLASWLTHPVKSWVTGLKSTLDELKDLGPVPNEAAVSKPAEGRMQNPDTSGFL